MRETAGGRGIAGLLPLQPGHNQLLVHGYLGSDQKGVESGGRRVRASVGGRGIGTLQLHLGQLLLHGYLGRERWEECVSPHPGRYLDEVRQLELAGQVLGSFLVLVRRQVQLLILPELDLTLADQGVVPAQVILVQAQVD